MMNQAQNNGGYPSAPPRRSFSMNPNDMFHGSLMGFAPPPPSFFSSYPPSNAPAAMSNFYYNHHQQELPAVHHQLAAAPPPPLLPLPATAPIGRPHHGSLPTAKKPSRGGRKPRKPAKRSDEPKHANAPAAAAANPSQLPYRKDVFPKVPAAVKEIPALSLADEVLISMLAPPPSSLPLPRFSLRPKRLSSCTAEAAVSDNGPADRFRQILRLR
ncbi:unnamed protein product [Linum trigynum]|uniref:Uncharacterized protein n=1 Tax=Linum trigynum TaxID=586398 RepID=A0AAV2CGG9_9ROSI